MKNIAQCEYCNEIFKKEDYGDYKNYKYACMEHEITHLNLVEKFKENLSIAIKELDKKHDTISIVKEVSINISQDHYDGSNLIYIFSIENNKLKQISSAIWVSYSKKEIIPTVEEIINKLENKFFVQIPHKKYEGILKLDTYHNGSHEIINDCIIGDISLRELGKLFRGKRVIFEILD